MNLRRSCPVCCRAKQEEARRVKKAVQAHHKTVLDKQTALEIFSKQSDDTVRAAISAIKIPYVTFANDRSFSGEGNASILSAVSYIARNWLILNKGIPHSFWAMSSGVEIIRNIDSTSFTVPLSC